MWSHLVLIIIALATKIPHFDNYVHNKVSPNLSIQGSVSTPELPQTTNTPNRFIERLKNIPTTTVEYGKTIPQAPYSLNVEYWWGQLLLNAGLQRDGSGQSWYLNIEYGNDRELRPAYKKKKSEETVKELLEQINSYAHKNIFLTFYDKDIVDVLAKLPENARAAYLENHLKKNYSTEQEQKISRKPLLHNAKNPPLNIFALFYSSYFLYQELKTLDQDKKNEAMKTIIRYQNDLARKHGICPEKCYLENIAAIEKQCYGAMTQAILQNINTFIYLKTEAELDIKHQQIIHQKKEPFAQRCTECATFLTEKDLQKIRLINNTTHNELQTLITLIEDEREKNQQLHEQKESSLQHVLKKENRNEKTNN